MFTRSCSALRFLLFSQRLFTDFFTYMYCAFAEMSFAIETKIVPENYIQDLNLRMCTKRNSKVLILPRDSSEESSHLTVNSQILVRGRLFNTEPEVSCGDKRSSTRF